MTNFHDVIKGVTKGKIKKGCQDWGAFWTFKGLKKAVLVTCRVISLKRSVAGA